MEWRRLINFRTSRASATAPSSRALTSFLAFLAPFFRVLERAHRRHLAELDGKKGDSDAPGGEECNSIKDAPPAPCVAFSTFLRLLPYSSRLFLSLMLPRKSEGARWRRLRARQLSSIPDSIFTHNFTWILCDVCPPWACQFI